MIQRLGLGPDSLVVELGSNDGYLLRTSSRAGSRSSGIDPAANVAPDAEERGVRTLAASSARDLARELVALRACAPT